MTTVLIIILSSYCGIAYGVAGMIWFISFDFRIRDVFKFLLAPIIGIGLIIKLVLELFQDRW